MELKVLSGGSKACGAGSCPTVYDLDEDHLVVQGWNFGEIEGIPDAESAIRIPKSILRGLEF